MATFAAELGACLVAEGVETSDELTGLLLLGVPEPSLQALGNATTSNGVGAPTFVRLTGAGAAVMVVVGRPAVHPTLADAYRAPQTVTKVDPAPPLATPEAPPACRSARTPPTR